MRPKRETGWPDWVEENTALTPAIEYVLFPAVEAFRERNLVGVAQHETIPDVELGIGTLEVDRFGGVERDRAIVDQHVESIGDVIDAVSQISVGVESKVPFLKRRIPST